MRAAVKTRERRLQHFAGTTPHQNAKVSRLHRNQMLGLVRELKQGLTKAAHQNEKRKRRESEPSRLPKQLPDSFGLIRPNVLADNRTGHRRDADENANTNPEQISRRHRCSHLRWLVP